MKEPEPSKLGCSWLVSEVNATVHLNATVTAPNPACLSAYCVQRCRADVCTISQTTQNLPPLVRARALALASGPLTLAQGQFVYVLNWFSFLSFLLSEYIYFRREAWLISHFVRASPLAAAPASRRPAARAALRRTITTRRRTTSCPRSS